MLLTLHVEGDTVLGDKARGGEKIKTALPIRCVESEV